MSLDGLPDGAYLAWRYVDGHRHIDRAQVYWDDGRVEAIENGERDELCRFSAGEVEAARRAIVESGLPAATDRARDDAYDTAALTYWWRAEGRCGALVNTAYPAEQPAEIERLEARLAELEEKRRRAGRWWRTSELQYSEPPLLRHSRAPLTGARLGPAVFG